MDIIAGGDSRWHEKDNRRLFRGPTLFIFKEQIPMMNRGVIIFGEPMKR